MQESPKTQDRQSPAPEKASERELRLLQLQAQALEELNRRFGSTFLEYIKHQLPDYPVHYKHIAKMIDVLQRVESGELTRVMFFMPPANFKSSTASRLFPGYYLYKHPERRVILTSHTGDSALDLSKDARDYYLKTGKELAEDTSAASDWRTEKRGGLFAAGVGGPIMGRRGDILMIDDLVRSWEDAYSDELRQKQWDWFLTSFYTRMELVRKAAIVITLTRWHSDDIPGRLMRMEEASPENWHIVCFEAIKEEKSMVVPEGCTLEADWRKVGEALCPELQPLKSLIKIRAKSESQFSALYQQRPTAEGGSVWKRHWFKSLEDSEFDKKVLMDVGTDWDLAYTKDEANSANAFVKAGIGTDGNIYVDDLDFKWLEFPELIKWMMEIGEPYFVEQKAAGKSAVQMLTKANLYAMEVKVRGGDKIARSRIASPIVEQGRVYVRASLMRKLLDNEQQGLLPFPAASHSDLNDAFVQMLNRLHPYDVEVADEEKAPTSVSELFESLFTTPESTTKHSDLL